MKIISTRARIASFLLALLTSALVLGSTLIGFTEADQTGPTVVVMERPAGTASAALN